MTNRQASDDKPTRDGVGAGGMRPPAALPPTRKKGIIVRLFWA